MLSRLKDNGAFTIIEVLISAAVFMVGFSILVALLSTSLTRFSSRELTLAECVGREIMTLAVALKDTTGSDTTLSRSGIRFRIEKTTETENGLAKIRVIVYRDKTNRKILDIYNEFILPKPRP